MTAILRSSLALLLAAPALAQVQTIATESFDYPVPGLLINNGGGTGFVSAWDVQPAGNHVVMFDPTILNFAGRDGVGAYIGQAVGFGRALRELDTGSHPDVVDLGGFGRDGATMWISFHTVAYQVFGASFGALTLRDSGTGDKLTIGSPFGTYEWGIDTLAPAGAGVQTIPGTTVTNDAVILVRIDHMPGDERLRMWINPSSNIPIDGADLDTMIPDLRWNQVQFSSGGAGSGYFWDGLRIAKGGPDVGTNYCSAAPNSTGATGVIGGLGSAVAADNNFLLTAESLPPQQFGIFVTSRTQGFIPGAGGTSNGNLCLSGSIGRFREQSQIRPTGLAGAFSLQVDLGAVPLGAGTVAVVAGETWNFQAWHREGVGLGSNFTDGLSVTFQ